MMSAATLKYTASYWAAQLAAAATDLPTARLVAWIAEESGGNPASVPANGFEVGIAQINTQDGAFHSWTREQLHGTGAWTNDARSQVLTRALTADEESIQVQSTIQQARDCLAQAQTQIGGNTWSSQDTWAMCKMNHALGHGGTTWLVNQATSASAMSSWSAFKGYVLSLTASQIPSNIVQGRERGLRAYYPFNRFFVNSERVSAADGSTPDGTGDAGGQPLGLAALDLLTALALVAIAAVGYYLSR